MYKIHKESIWRNVVNRDGKITEPLCKQVTIKFLNDMSKDWSKVTCKRCLKLRKRK